MDLCISVIEQFWCCSLGRELDPDRTLEDGQVSKSLPHPCPPIDVTVCDTYPACIFPGKVVLTSYLIEALEFPRPVPQGPIGLPSCRMELLSVRRSTSLPNWIDCTYEGTFQLFLCKNPPSPLAAWIKWSIGAGKRSTRYLPGMMQLSKTNHFGVWWL